MGEFMGTLRPVKQQEKPHGQQLVYSVEPVGETATSVRYHLIEDVDVTEILDEIRLSYAEGADGFALFDQAGELLGWWAFIVPIRGGEIRISAGFGFKTSAIGAAARQREKAEAGSH
jgi:hypothetical protein